MYKTDIIQTVFCNITCEKPEHLLNDFLREDINLVIIKKEEK